MPENKKPKMIEENVKGEYPYNDSYQDPYNGEDDLEYWRKKIKEDKELLINTCNAVLSNNSLLGVRLTNQDETILKKDINKLINVNYANEVPVLEQLLKELNDQLEVLKRLVTVYPELLKLLKNEIESLKKVSDTLKKMEGDEKFEKYKVKGEKTLKDFIEGMRKNLEIILKNCEIIFEIIQKPKDERKKQIEEEMKKWGPDQTYGYVYDLGTKETIEIKPYTIWYEFYNRNDDINSIVIELIEQLRKLRELYEKDIALILHVCNIPYGKYLPKGNKAIAPPSEDRLLLQKLINAMGSSKVEKIKGDLIKKRNLEKDLKQAIKGLEKDANNAFLELIKERFRTAGGDGDSKIVRFKKEYTPEIKAKVLGSIKEYIKGRDKGEYKKDKTSINEGIRKLVGEVWWERIDKIFDGIGYEPFVKRLHEELAKIGAINEEIKAIQWRMKNIINPLKERIKRIKDVWARLKEREGFEEAIYNVEILEAYLDNFIGEVKKSADSALRGEIELTKKGMIDEVERLISEKVPAFNWEHADKCLLGVFEAEQEIAIEKVSKDINVMVDHINLLLKEIRVGVV